MQARNLLNQDIEQIGELSDIGRNAPFSNEPFL
jgi:hypothetical protein